MNDRLCSVCAAIFANDNEPVPLTEETQLLPISRPECPHHPSLQSFRAAVERGCYICSVVDFKFAGTFLVENDVPEPLTFRHVNVSEAQASTVCVAINPACVAASAPTIQSQFRVQFGEVDPMTPLNWPPSTRLSLLKKWVDDCCQGDTGHHEYCRRYRALGNGDSRKDPLHLLQLGEGERQGFVKIVNVDSDFRPPYVTMGHPWIDLNVPRGLDTTVGEWLSTTTVPRSVQDAIIITQAAGIGYLWLPFLSCIGCQTDENAVSRRGSAYAGGVFTIAALSAVNADVGCLPATNDIRHHVPAVNSARDPTRLLIVHDHESLTTSVDKSSLWASADFHQALLLSPAILYCTTQQLWWECLDRVLRCETFPNGIGYNGNSNLRVEDPYQYSFRPLVTLMSGTALGGVIASPPPFAERLVGFWITIVCALSSTDNANIQVKRLVADNIAWLVGQFAIQSERGTLPATYSTGLWSENVAYQLSWRAERFPPTYEPFVQHRASQACPTWSWLSIDGPVSYLFLHPNWPISMVRMYGPMSWWAEPVVRAVDFAPEEGSLPNTEMTITLRGHLLTLRIGELPEGSATAVDRRGTLELGGSISILLDCAEEAQIVDQADAENEYFALPLFARTYDSVNRFVMRGIVLRRPTWGGDYRFRRCGAFDHNGSSAGQGLEERLSSIQLGLEDETLQDTVVII